MIAHTINEDGAVRVDGEVIGYIRPGLSGDPEVWSHREDAWYVITRNSAVPGNDEWMRLHIGTAFISREAATYALVEGHARVTA